MVTTGGPPSGSDLYPEPASRRRAVVSWCLFDFSSSAYTTVIITVAFSVYFREAVVNAPDNSGDRLWGIANFLAMLVVAITSPVLGAIADYSGRRKLFLIVSTLLTVGATFLLVTVGPGQIARAMLLYVLGTIGFEAGYVFYNSFLPEVSTPRTIGRVSGWAWGIGFAGGIASLLLCKPWLSSELRRPDGSLSPEAIGDRQLAFVVVGLFVLVFALPAFRWLRQPGGRRLGSWAGYVPVGLGRVRQTLTHLREYREVGKYILASLFFNDGITTVISFSAIYATTTFGFSMADLTVMFIVLNVVGIPGAIGAGYLADLIGGKRTVVLSLVLWVAVVLVGYAATTKTQFLVMAAGAAVGMGSTQAVGRSLMAEITPRARLSEFFGFYVLSGKFAAITGPLIFGLISAASGSQRLAVLSLLPLFLAGLGLLLTVDYRRARDQARAADATG